MAAESVDAALDVDEGSLFAACVGQTQYAGDSMPRYFVVIRVHLSLLSEMGGIFSVSVVGAHWFGEHAGVFECLL